ncbi:P-loop containing nucleoside triphosphate hydrolase protein [Ochromonadaceae sp. CCMP2298]|nr:P-loop containing nucleoside triphosphate hydrolase protein [Ochromonadaceae sp. CCMP2298]
MRHSPLLLLLLLLLLLSTAHAWVAGVTSLSKSYPRLFRPDKQALVNVSLRFPRDKIVALVGPSGSGKSTLGKLILGVKGAKESPTSGRVDVGADVVDTAGVAGGAVDALSCSYLDHLFAMQYDESRPIHHTLGTVHPLFSDALSLALQRAHINPTLSAASLLVSQRKVFEILLVLARSGPPPYVLVLDEYLDRDMHSVRLKVVEQLRGLCASVPLQVFVVTHSKGVLRECTDHAVVLDRGRVWREGSSAGVQTPYNMTWLI